MDGMENRRDAVQIEFPDGCHGGEREKEEDREHPSISLSHLSSTSTSKCSIKRA